MNTGTKTIVSNWAGKNIAMKMQPTTYSSARFAMMNWIEAKAKQQEMESVLSRLCSLLQKSQDSAFASETQNSLLQKVQAAHHSVKSTGKVPEPNQLLLLFAPTGALQDTSIDNSRGIEFNKIANTVEQCIEACS